MTSFAGGAPGVVAASPFDESSPSWSPDGSLIAFFRGDSLMVVPPSPDANPHRVGISHGSGPATWSADGQTIAYLVSNRGPIALVQLATGREQLVPIPDSVGTAAERLAVSPEGREIIVSSALRAQDSVDPVACRSGRAPLDPSHDAVRGIHTAQVEPERLDLPPERSIRRGRFRRVAHGVLEDPGTQRAGGICSTNAGWVHVLELVGLRGWPARRVHASADGSGSLLGWTQFRRRALIKPQLRLRQPHTTSLGYSTVQWPTTGARHHHASSHRLSVQSKRPGISPGIAPPGLEPGLS